MREGGSVSKELCLQGAGWARLPDTWDTTGYGQQVGSTHHTGMHSCFNCFFA